MIEWIIHFLMLAIIFVLPLALLVMGSIWLIQRGFGSRGK